MLESLLCRRCVGTDLRLVGLFPLVRQFEPRPKPRPLFRSFSFDRWPAAATRPTANTLWRWLKRGCALGALVRNGDGIHGDGIRGDAHRYALAAEEPKAPAA